MLLYVSGKQNANARAHMQQSSGLLAHGSTFDGTVCMLTEEETRASPHVDGMYGTHGCSQLWCCSM